MLFKNPVRTSKRTPHFTITKINWLTLFKFNIRANCFVLPHGRCPYFDVVLGLAWSNDPERYAGGRVATGRVSLAGQVKGNDRLSWGLGVRLTTSHRKNYHCYETQLRSGLLQLYSRWWWWWWWLFRSYCGLIWHGTTVISQINITKYV
jgi:hypothetical protein